MNRSDFQNKKVPPYGIPVEFKVIVKQHQIEEKSSGGIILPEDIKKREQIAETKAVIMAVGGNAFSDFEGIVPEVGDTVIVRKYAGYTVTGSDGVEYQVCNDKDISLILELGNE